MKTMLIAVLLAAGCSSSTMPIGPADGPSAQDLEVAYEIAWEGLLGMPKETRPAIVWWTPCDVPASGVDVTKPDAHCWWSVWRPDGTADLQWRGKFTAVPATFNQALVYEKWWQEHPDQVNDPVPDQSTLNKKVYQALLDAGL